VVELTRVVGGILVRDGLILLGMRSTGRSYPGTWDVIGGHCEPGESDEESLVRELREELGIVTVQYRSIGIFHEPEGHPVYCLHLFAVEQWLGTPTNCSTEHSTVEWHSPIRLAGLPLASERYREILSRF
jgi:8-oxo-dGTP diphosphatase